MRTLIIDDEPQSHQTLTQYFARNHPGVELLASAYNITEGYRIIQEHQPELVFLDVEMPDGTGFDLLEKFPSPDFSVIFITAHAKYAVTAFRCAALDFLEKPIDEKNLASALERAKKELGQKIDPEQLKLIQGLLLNVDSAKLPTRVDISTLEGIHFLEVNSITRLEAQQNYTQFYLDDKRKVLASLNLKNYTDKFAPYPAIRQSHRSHIVNLNFVDRFVKSDGGYLVMKDGATVPVSRRYKDDLLDGLRTL